MNIWLDDERPAPEGWYWAKTTEEVESALLEKSVDWISLDHDLGMDEIGNIIDSGIAVLEWLEYQAKGEDNDCWPSRVSIHSANPVGRQNMERIINASRLYSRGKMIYINGYPATEYVRQDTLEMESSVKNLEFLSNDFDRYDIYAFNEPVVSVSSISIALQQYRQLSREISPRLREANLKIYDNYSKQWIR